MTSRRALGQELSFANIKVQVAVQLENRLAYSCKFQSLWKPTNYRRVGDVPTEQKRGTNLSSELRGGADEHVKHDGGLKMFIQYPLNLQEEQKNLMKIKFHNTNLFGENHSLFLSSFCPYPSVHSSHICKSLVVCCFWNLEAKCDSLIPHFLTLLPSLRLLSCLALHLSLHLYTCLPRYTSSIYFCSQFLSSFLRKEDKNWGKTGWLSSKITGLVVRVMCFVHVYYTNTIDTFRVCQVCVCVCVCQCVPVWLQSTKQMTAYKLVQARCYKREEVASSVNAGRARVFVPASTWTDFPSRLHNQWTLPVVWAWSCRVLSAELLCVGHTIWRSLHLFLWRAMMQEGDNHWTWPVVWAWSCRALSVELLCVGHTIWRSLHLYLRRVMMQEGERLDCLLPQLQLRWRI